MPPGLKPALWQAAKIAVPVLSSVLALVIVGQFIDWRAALDDALRAPPWAMAAGVALIWLQLSLCGLRLRLLALSFGAEMPLRAATSVWSLSYLGGLVLPTSVGSELVKGAALLGWTRLPVTIIGLLALERLAAILALLLLVLIAAPLAAWRIGSEYTLPLGMLCALAFAAICFGLAMRQRAAAGLRWLLTACRVPVGVVDKLVAAVGAPWRVVGLSLAIHLMTLIVIGLLLFGFSSPSPLLEAALGGTAGDFCFSAADLGRRLWRSRRRVHFGPRPDGCRRLPSRRRGARVVGRSGNGGADSGGDGRSVVARKSSEARSARTVSLAKLGLSGWRSCDSPSLAQAPGRPRRAGKAYSSKVEDTTFGLVPSSDLWRGFGPSTSSGVSR